MADMGGTPQGATAISMMHNKCLRVVLLSCDGLPQRYLLAQLAANFSLVGCVTHSTPNAAGSLASRVWRYRNPLVLARYLKARISVPRYEAAALPLVESLFHIEGTEPIVPDELRRVHVGNINAPAAVEFVANLKPDIICVNGTNLLREPMLALIPGIRFGIINLHTGLSPYSRGGNCNLFMLLEGKPEFVGVTVHHIDKGIDSGDIIYTARPELEASDTFETIEAKGFRLGIDLIIAAVQALADGRSPRVPQWEMGKLFLRRTGYVYEPYQRVKVNNMIAAGLLRDYLENREARDQGIRLIRASES